MELKQEKQVIDCHKTVDNWASNFKQETTIKVMGQLDVKFTVPNDYKTRLESYGMRFVKRERILDKYYDTPELRLLNAGAFLRKRNQNLELKCPMDWQGDYSRYDGVTEFQVTKDCQAEASLHEIFQTKVKDMVILCTVKFEREQWICEDYVVVIDRMDIDDAAEAKIVGELKLYDRKYPSLQQDREEAVNHLRNLVLKQTMDGKLMIALVKNNHLAYLKLIEMMKK